MTYNFDKMTWLGVLDRAFHFTDPDWTWYIDGDGVVYLKETSTTADHTLIVGKHVAGMNIKKTLYTIINSCTVFYNGGNVTVSNSDSITNYGLAESIIEDSNITDSTLASQRATFEVLNNKDPLFTGTVQVNQIYDIESIKVGDTVQFKNVGPDSLIGDVICTVASISYALNGATLELTRTRSNFQRFINSIFSMQTV